MRAISKTRILYGRSPFHFGGVQGGRARKCERGPTSTSFALFGGLLFGGFFRVQNTKGNGLFLSKIEKMTGRCLLFYNMEWLLHGGAESA